MRAPARLLTLVLVLGTPLAACRGVYYSTMETFGVHKREILVDRVEDGRDAQAEAKEEFESALEHFQAVAGFDGGDLEDLYGRLKKDLSRCEDRVEDVRDRIDSIETVSEDLFDEWEEEIEQIQSPDLSRRSEESLAQARARYTDLIAAMKRAERKMEPVLVSFRDHVLFLKHNLNAQAIASLQGSLFQIETDVSDLIREMEVSIAEADSFLAGMESSE